MSTRIVKRALVWPDTHTPYESKEAVETAICALRGYAPDELIVLGDFFDCYKISAYSKDPDRLLSFKEEIVYGREMLGKIATTAKKANKNCRLIFLMGNHEVRLHKYIAQQAQELHGFLKPKDLFGLQDWDVRNYGDYYEFGMIQVSHDFGYSGNHAHMKAASMFGSSVVNGHTHGAGVTYFGTGNRKKHVALSSGWLGDSEYTDYTHKKHTERNWIHGVSTLALLSDGMTHVQFHPILNGNTYIDGKVYSCRNTR